MEIDSNKLVADALKMAHSHSYQNRAEVEKSSFCCCFSCKRMFAAATVTRWVDEDQTALCPICKVDSVIGDASDLPVIVPQFVLAMHDYWLSSDMDRLDTLLDEL